MVTNFKTKEKSDQNLLRPCTGQTSHCTGWPSLSVPSVVKKIVGYSLPHQHPPFVTQVKHILWLRFSPVLPPVRPGVPDHDLAVPVPLLLVVYPVPILVKCWSIGGAVHNIEPLDIIVEPS